MTRKNSTTMFNELLLECMTKPDPMLHLLEWLCAQLMETEVGSKLGAGKWERTGSRSGYRAAIASGNGILVWGLCICSSQSSGTEAISLSF